MNKDENKEIVKEALKEWLDDKFADLGRWSLGLIFALILAAMLYFVLWANGWHNEFVPEPNPDAHKRPFSGKKLEG